jgi:hypothetical protein
MKEYTPASETPGQLPLAVCVYGTPINKHTQMVNMYTSNLYHMGHCCFGSASILCYSSDDISPCLIRHKPSQDNLSSVET